VINHIHTKYVKEYMMDEQERRTALAQFLRTRRERVSPDGFGLPMGKRRRTPGLRREELALLAGVGITWYTWLEQGRDITVSAPVLESLARVLQLNADERIHLFLLAREQLPAAPIPAIETVNPALQLILDSMGVYPAYAICPRWDIMAWNQAAARLYGDFSTLSGRERNLLWQIFMSQGLRTQIVDWEAGAQHAVALFRASTQRAIGEAWLTELVTDLTQASPEFREWWSRYDIQDMYPCQMQLDHPLVGLLDMQVTSFQLTDHSDLRMLVHTPVPGTETQAKLAALSTSGSALQLLGASQEARLAS
jgi:transcriptional regulator with XRE-family HTH domain